MLMQFSFELNFDQKVIERSIYTWLDLLSDIGGILSIFMGGISFALAIFNYKNFEYHFLQNFFRIKSSKATENNA